MFSYERSPALKMDMEDRRRVLEVREKALQEGVRILVSLHFEAENSLNVKCGLLGNEDIILSGFNVDLTYKGGTSKCSSDDGGKGHTITFDNVYATVTSGEITIELQQVAFFGSSSRYCKAQISLNKDEILGLFNKDRSVTKELSGCRGAELIMTPAPINN